MFSSGLNYNHGEISNLLEDIPDIEFECINESESMLED